MEVLERFDMVCVGAEIVDEYEAEGFLLRSDGKYAVVIIERDNSRGIVSSVWIGTFHDREEARNSLKDLLYNLGRLNDKGFGCYEAIPIKGPRMLTFRMS